MSVFTELGNTMTTWVKDSVKFRAIDKDKLRKSMLEQKTAHQKLSELFFRATFNTGKEFLQEYRTKVKALEKTMPSAGIYDTYLNLLDNKSVGLEHKQFMLSLGTTNKMFVTILDEILKNFDKLITDNSINIFNTRLSNLAIFGIYRQSDVLINWTYWFWSQTVRIITGNTENMHPYRGTYLLNNVKQVATIVSEVVNQQGAYSFLKEVNNIRQKHHDLQLNFYGAGGDSLMNFITPSNFTLGFTSNMGSALSALNIFRHVQEKWDLWQNEKYQINKERLDWMTQHVALLRLQQMNISKDDPQYVALMKIINKYDDLIAERSEQIAKYENGD